MFRRPRLLSAPRVLASLEVKKIDVTVRKETVVRFWSILFGLCPRTRICGQIHENPDNRLHTRHQSLLGLRLRVADLPA